MIAEFYHMYSKELLFLIASLFLYIICRYFNQGETQLVKLISQPIHLPFWQMEKICNETILQNTEILETERYKLIHYIDTESCVVCELKAMYQWNDFLIKTGLEKSVQLYYIIDTRNHNRKELIAAINETYIQGEGYFDKTLLLLLFMLSIVSIKSSSILGLFNGLPATMTLLLWSNKNV